MIYRILKILCKLTIHYYFRRVKITGKEKIPEKGPYIFVANHPSAFMDPIVAASFIKPQVYFIAAGEYIGKGFKAWIFKKFLHMIPVFRPGTMPEDVHKNKNMFEQCYIHLGNQGSLLVFPEGVSVTEQKIKPLKTGVARIARGAELKYGRDLNISVIPIGLNYSNPHQFRSDLYINIGDPIFVNNFISDSDQNEMEEVREITEIMEKRLIDSVIHLETEEDQAMLDKLNEIYSSDLKKELGVEFKEQEREFKIYKDMIEAIKYFKSVKPDEYDRIQNLIDEYLLRLEEKGVKDRDIKKNSEGYPWRRKFNLAFGFPLFLFGMINNFVPYYSVRIIINRLKISETFVGSIILASGLVIYSAWYLTITITLILFTPLKWFGLLYPVVMYATGIYAMIYRGLYDYHRERKWRKDLLEKDEKSGISLMEQRNYLIGELNKAREEFDNKIIRHKT